MTIGSGVKEIGEYAFIGVYQSAEIYSLPIIPPTCLSSWVFSNDIYKTAVVYVPNEGNADVRYKTEDVWKNFHNIQAKNLSYLDADYFNVTLSPAGYATFYDSGHAYTLPEGLSAQVVSDYVNYKLVYTTIANGNADEAIPKGTAVMLVGDSKEAGTYTLSPAEKSESYTGKNLLHGSDNSTTTTASGANYFYKLTYGKDNQSDVFGWYWGATDGAAFQIEGHKAWLALLKSIVTRGGFALDNDVTGIEDIEISGEPTDDAVMYDLRGRRVNAPKSPGIYIVNGKKVLIQI